MINSAADEIARHERAYRTGKPEITDAEFDALVEQELEDATEAEYDRREEQGLDRARGLE